MQIRDYGQIVAGSSGIRVYMRILEELPESHMIYSPAENDSGKYLISSDSFFSKLIEVHRRFGIESNGKKQLEVSVRLPNSDERGLRERWQPTVIKRSNIPYIGPEFSFSLLNFQGLFHYMMENVLATPEWMDDFYADSGDSVIIASTV